VASNYPSLVIGFWICVAFVVGRLAARLGWRWRMAVRVVVSLVAIALGVYVFWFHITWHAALIPAALVLGAFSYGHQKLAPGVFK
jgi:uncharacterized membrane protein